MSMSRIVMAAILNWSAVISTGAQTSNCKDMAYENRNQIDYARPIQVAALVGVVRDAQNVRIPKACVGIFTESGHRLVAKAETGDSGEFAIQSVPNGDYRLIVKYIGFCSANALIRFRQRSGRNKPLVVHMRPAGVDTCSYIDRK